MSHSSSRRYSYLIGAGALVFCAASAMADSTGGIGEHVSFVPTANAATAPPERADVRPPASIAQPLIFSAPPHESLEEAARVYEPLARYFSRVLGRKVEYRHPRSWLTYQSEAAKGVYDIVFDEPHFNSWNIARLHHTALAKLADENVFVVIARKDDAQLTSVKQLAGNKLCAIGASNLGALALLAEFDALRQPLIIENPNWARVVEGVIEGRCAAATLPLAMLQKFDRKHATRTIHRSRALPNQVFSASPRLSTDEQAKLASALVSAEGNVALATLLSANGAAKGFTPASKDEYAGLDAYLKDVWGYGH